MMKKNVVISLLVLLLILLFTPFSYAADGSCKNPNGGTYCNTKNPELGCHCDAACDIYGDCCDDYIKVCQINAPPPPVKVTADITANDAGSTVVVPYNSSVKITWASTNANSCDIYRGTNTKKGDIVWSDTGNTRYATITSNTVFRLRCTGPGGTASDEIIVMLEGNPTKVTADITANDAGSTVVVPYNSSVKITWASTNANSCDIYRGTKVDRGNLVWSDTGNTRYATITSDTVFHLTCTGPGGTASDEIIVTPQANENMEIQHTLVIVASIGNKQPSADVETVREVVFGEKNTVNDFYIKNSFGKISLTGNVVGPYTLPESICDGNGDGTFKQLGEAVKAADSDVNFNDYSRIILDIPKCSQQLSYAGFGTLGKIGISTKDGNIMASVSWDYDFNMRVVGHELGHNFGASHANLMECLNCESNEYSDPLDIMGLGVMHMNAPHKEEVGWLRENTIVANEGEFLIKPLETQQPRGVIQQVKLPLKNIPELYSSCALSGNRVYYSLEFRQPIDYDSGGSDSLYTGVLLYISADSDCILQTNIINLNFDLLNPDSDFSPRLQVGRTYFDAINGYKIKLKSADANGALVSITRFTDSDPSVEINYPNQESSWNAGSEETIIWKTKNIPPEQKMNIYLIDNKGAILPLATDTPNDGFESIRVLGSGFHSIAIKTDVNGNEISYQTRKFYIQS